MSATVAVGRTANCEEEGQSLGSWGWTLKNDWRPLPEGQTRATARHTFRGRPEPKVSLRPSEHKGAPLGRKGFCGEQRRLTFLILAGNPPGAQRVLDPLLVE